MDKMYISEKQKLKIEELNEKTQELTQSIEYHRSEKDPHLKHKLKKIIDSEIETQKEIWLMKIDKQYLNKNKKKLKIEEGLLDSDGFKIIDIPDNEFENPKYKDAIVYYFPRKDFNIIKSLEEKINNLKYLIDSHCELINTHLNKNISDGYKKLEEFNNNLSELEKQLNDINDLSKYIEIKLKLLELEIEKYNFLFYFHTIEYNSYYK